MDLIHVFIIMTSWFCWCIVHFICWTSYVNMKDLIIILKVSICIYYYITHTPSTNVVNIMNIAFVIHIIKLGQNGCFSSELADFDSANILVFWILSRFYIGINDQIEKLCYCRLMRQKGREAKENKQFRRNDGCSCRRQYLINKYVTFLGSILYYLRFFFTLLILPYLASWFPGRYI